MVTSTFTDRASPKGAEARLLQRFTGSARDLKQLCLDLLQIEFQASSLVESAVRQGVQQKLGYLAEVTAQAAEHRGQPGARKLEHLARSLYRPFDSWMYLGAVPAWERRLWTLRAKTKLNHKWKIYEVIEPAEVEDWIDLYLSPSYANPARE